MLTRSSIIHPPTAEIPFGGIRFDEVDGYGDAGEYYQPILVSTPKTAINGISLDVIRLTILTNARTTPVPPSLIRTRTPRDPIAPCILLKTQPIRQTNRSRRAASTVSRRCRIARGNILLGADFVAVGEIAFLLRHDENWQRGWKKES